MNMPTVCHHGSYGRAVVRNEPEKNSERPHRVYHNGRLVRGYSTARPAAAHAKRLAHHPRHLANMRAA